MKHLPTVMSLLLFSVTVVAEQPIPEIAQKLSVTSRIEISSELAGMFQSPIRCDGDGNIYLFSSNDGTEGVRKLDPKGRLVAAFRAVSQPDLQVDGTGYFSVSKDGSLAMLVFPHDIKRYVFNFGSDGKLKSKVKLDPGFAWMPAQIALFPNGYYFATGQRITSTDDVMPAFTGLFSDSGALVKQISLPGDKKLGEKAAGGDEFLISPQNPKSNRSISLGSVEIGQDNNVYLMRRSNPPVVYVISQTGEILRQFEVTVSDKNFVPMTMLMASSRISVLFRDPQTKQQRIRIVDLEGKPIALYEEQAADPKLSLGPAYACYTENPETFTFLSTSTDHHLVFKIAEIK